MAPRVIGVMHSPTSCVSSMSEPMSFRLDRTAEFDPDRPLDALASLLVFEGLRWRFGLSESEEGPLVGSVGTSDVVYDTRLVVGLTRSLIPGSLMTTRDPEEVPSTGLDARAASLIWLRRVLDGHGDGPDVWAVREAAGAGFDRSTSIAHLDSIGAKIIGFWAASDEGLRRLAAWAANRETERRSTGRRLVSLGERYDRDLLLLADRLETSE